MTTHKIDIVNNVAEATGMTKKDANLAVEAVITSITASLAKGNDVTLTGFGHFVIRDRAARKGRNPQTGEEIKIAATKVPAFKPGKSLKEVVK